MSWMICKFFSTHSDKVHEAKPVWKYLKPLIDIFVIVPDKVWNPPLFSPHVIHLLIGLVVKADVKKHPCALDVPFPPCDLPGVPLLVIPTVPLFIKCVSCCFLDFLQVFSHSVLEHFWFNLQMFMLYVYTCLWQSHSSVSSLSFEVREELCFSHWALFTLLLFGVWTCVFIAAI